MQVGYIAPCVALGVGCYARQLRMRTHMYGLPWSWLGYLDTWIPRYYTTGQYTEYLSIVTRAVQPHCRCIA